MTLKKGQKHHYRLSDDVEPDERGDVDFELVGEVGHSEYDAVGMVRVSVTLQGESNAFSSFEIHMDASPERVYVALGIVADAMLEGFRLARESAK